MAMNRLVPASVVAGLGCSGLLLSCLWLAPAVAADASASPVQPALEINALPAETVPVPAGEPLGELGRGLAAYWSFDSDLMGFSAQSVAVGMRFSRETVAFLPDLKPAGPGVPRLVKARFGQGILIEYGHTLAGRNQLPVAMADAEASPAGFRPAGDGKLGLGPGLEGRAALRVEVAAAGGGFCTDSVTAPATNAQTFSVYLQGPKDAPLQAAVWFEGADKPVASTSLLCTGDWQRVALHYPGNDQKIPGHAVPDARTAPLRLEVRLNQPGVLFADALMLEAHAGYGGRRGVSSWVPGESGRDGEVLAPQLPVAPQSGTLAFWLTPWGDMNWRVLLCMADDHGWNPDLRIDLRDNRRLDLVLGQKNVSRADLPEPWAEGQWHHLAVTWEGATAVLYVDGLPRITVADAPVRTRWARLILGGVPTNFSPGVRADAVFDEFGVWRRALAAAEVQALARREQPLAAGIDTRLTLADREPIDVFNRDPEVRYWPVRLTNRADAAQSGMELRYGLAGVFSESLGLPPLPGRSQVDLRLPWRPVLAEAGAYEMQVRVTGPGVDREVVRPVTIVPARVPAGNAQVITWGGNEADLASLGITVAGLSAGDRFGPLPSHIAQANRNGLYSQVRQGLLGRSGSPDDRFQDCTGKPGETDQRASAAQADVDAKATELGAHLALLPDVRYMIINTEHQLIHGMDFRPATREWVRKTFGLDLTPWTGVDPKKGWAVVHPMGRLAVGAGNYPLPATGVLEAADPFYAYHRWWHSDAAGTEVFLNDRIAATVRRQAPWVQMIAEPALRRPAVKAFRQQDIIEEWYYYPNPRKAVWVQESLTAAARGTTARITGMPQFLFKPGMAAPYGGMPTPDMFRETVWHCLARPLTALVYWNLWSAVGKSGKNVMTQDEIDAKLGVSPDWDTVKAKVAVKGEWSDVFLFIPELRGEITRLHLDTVWPLGALLPAWQNRPRELAVVRSFAGQLFNNVRWPGGDPLSATVDMQPHPFDVLYDQDFEENPRLLAGYRVVIIPECPVLTAPVAAQVRDFLARGGRVIVDDSFRPDFAGVTRVSWGKGETDAVALRKAEQELLKLYGRADNPLFIEGMEAAAKRFTADAGPTATALAAIGAALQPAVTTRARHVVLNELTAAGANYLVVVNDLRKPGRYYGHLGRVLDAGVAQEAVEVETDVAFGAVVYELLTCRRLPLAANAGRNRFALDLPAAGGKALVFLPEAIGALSIESGGSGNVRPGDTVGLRARLRGASGNPVPGLIPLAVTVGRPDGSRHDASHFSVLRAGEWSWELTLARNAPVGRYTATVKELASGQAGTLAWDVTVP